MLWKKSVGESRVDCFRVTLLDRRRRVDQKTWCERMEGEGVGYQRTNEVGDIQLVEKKKKTTDSSLILHHSEVCLFFVFGCTQINQGGSCLVQSVDKWRLVNLGKEEHSSTVKQFLCLLVETRRSPFSHFVRCFGVLTAKSVFHFQRFIVSVCSQRSPFSHSVRCFGVLNRLCKISGKEYMGNDASVLPDGIRHSGNC